MIYAGTIIEISNNKTYVFTMDYSVVAVKTKNDFYLGQCITFTKRDLYTNLYLYPFKSLKTLTLVAASIVLVTIMTLSLLINQAKPHKPAFDELCTAMISVDINPSIEIKINKEKQIVSATAANEDGTKVLNSINLKQLSLQEGVKKIVRIAKELGYIDKDTNVVLVSAAMYDSISEIDTEKYKSQLKDILSTMEGTQSDASVLTVFIEDSLIIKQAHDNKLSIGKELLYQYAIAQNGQLSTDDIRNASITDLFGKLKALKQDGNLIDDLAKPDSNNNITPTLQPPPSTTPTPTKSGENNDDPAAEPTTPDDDPAQNPTITLKPTLTPKPTKSPTTQSNEFKPHISVTSNSDSLDFSWTTLKSSNIVYKGQTYKEFQYYKIVASSTNPTPQYPDDGYLTYISDRNKCKWSVTPEEGNYNPCPELKSGQTYYFSITYVFGNGKFTSDVKTVKVPAYDGEPPCDDDTSYNLSMCSDCNSLSFEWTTVKNRSVNYNDETYSDFNYYKIVASKTNPNPSYPADGYLTYITDKDESCWNLSLSCDDYNHNPELISGETYYFSITYVFGNGKFCSNTIQYKVP